MSDGTVHVIGGINNGSSIYSIEIYDPNTNSWSSRVPLGQSKSHHFTIVTDSGDYFVNAIGSNGGEVVSIGGETSQASMIETYYPFKIGHTANLVNGDQNILVMGGQKRSAGALNTVELYHPENPGVTGPWSPMTSLLTARYDHTVSPLIWSGGNILVVGGMSSSEGALNSTEIYNPGSPGGTVISGPPLNFARYQHTANVFSNGTILVSGGLDWSGGAIDSVELYDYMINSWTLKANLNVGRYSHTSTLLNNGKVLVVGGVNEVVLSSVELYDPLANTWSITTPSELAEGRIGHTATLLQDGRVLITGGQSEPLGNRLSSVKIYDPSTDSWSSGISLGTARANHTATLLTDGKVSVAGGYGSWDLDSVEVYDPIADTWTAGSSLAKSRSHHTATSLLVSDPTLGPIWETIMIGGPPSTYEIYTP
jgi:N-acetylneuraminic acid mutarotase